MALQIKTQAQATLRPSPSAAPGNLLQRKCACGGTPGPSGECEACHRKREAGLLQRAAVPTPAFSLHSTEAPPIVHEVLRSPGQPLDATTRAFMEPRFGHDFSQVRVHTDAKAAESARAVDADAYTVGQHIVFDSNRFSPKSSAGRVLLAHELTHTIQQRSGAHGAAESPLAEREATEIGSWIEGATSPRSAQQATAPGLARQPKPGAPEAAPVPRSEPAQSPGSLPPTHTSIPAAQLLSSPTPPTGLYPGAPVNAALDTATDVGAPANAMLAGPISAAPAADDSIMPRLTDLLSQPQPQAVAIDAGARPTEVVSEGVAPGRISQNLEVDRWALLRKLALGASEARKIINSHSIAARWDIDWGAKKSRQKLEEQTKTGDEAVRALANKRRTQLDKTILAYDTGILWLEKQRKADANTYAGNARKAQTDGFGENRKDLADAFDSWVRKFEKLNKEQSDRLTQQTDKNDKAAWGIAKNYDTRYIQSYGGQSEERKQVQHDAVYDVARDYGAEIHKAKTEVLPEIDKACAQVKPELDKARDAALVEFDKGLPVVLSGIDAQLAAALEDISKKTAESRAMLAKCAVQMHARVSSLEDTALKRNAAFRIKIDGQIETGHAGAAREFRRAAPEAMEPIAAIMDDAVGMLTNSDEVLDADASRQFVDEVVDFSLDAADATSVMFAAARDAGMGTLAGAVPFAKRGLAAGKQDLEATLHAEGAENESALIRFGTEVEVYLKSSLTALDETFNAAVVEAGTKLGSMLNDTRAKLREPMEQTEEKIRKSVNEVLYQQNEARRNLPKVMHNAARQAAWRYDHPVLKHFVTAVEVVLGFALLVGALIALVVGLPVLVGEVAAAVILTIITLVGAFFLGYFGAKAYDERRQAGASGVSAFFGAVGDVTGINEVGRAFTDPKMAPFDRGMAWGGFWLNLFGLASGASRFLRVVKVRLPTKFTNPFRLKRSMVSATMPEGPVVPTLPEAPAIPEIGPQLPHQKLPAPDAPIAPVSPDVPAMPSPRVRGFAPRSEPTAPTAPVSPDVPVTPSPRVRGFAPQSEPTPPTAPVSPDVPARPSPRVRGFAPRSEPTAPMAPVSPDVPARPSPSVRGFAPRSKPTAPTAPASPDVPATPSRRVRGFAPKSEPAAPVPTEVPAKPPAATAPTSKAPPVDIPTPRQVSSGQATGASSMGQRGEQGAQAIAGQHEVAPPKASASEPASAGAPTTGKVVPAVEPVQPAAAAPPEAVPPIARPKSMRMRAAEKRVGETQKVMTEAQEATAAAEARVKVLEEELDVAKQLRSELGRESKEARELVAKTEGDLRTARKELKASQKALKKTTREAQEVARAEEAIRSLEQEIVDIDRQMAELTREPEPGTQLTPTKGMRPPTASVKSREYSRLEKLRAKKVNDLIERTKDLTRSLAEHVASMTPGAEGRPDALANAEALGEAHPAIKPVNGRPIDVTTGKPMLTDDWASDHIMSRNEIASDPRFALLDPAGREEMLLGIPENYLPMTTEANSSKGSLTINEWLAKRSDIPDPLRAALRKADEEARIAVEAKFKQLLGAKP